MPPEDARFVLPIGTAVNVVMTVNPRTLMHVADVWAAADGQWEIRELTEEILSIAADWCRSRSNTTRSTRKVERID